MTSKISFLFTAFMMVFLTSCDKDPDPVNEEELITTLEYTLTPRAGGDVVKLTFRDLDGDGGNPPVITSGTLKSGKVYDGTLSLLNESESPVEDITEEIEEEDAEHQFFFEVSTSIASNLVIVYNDKDADNNPVGLKTVVTTTGTGSGTLKITLRHEPNKSASGVAAGNIANAGGETDIEVSFNVRVEL
ncbi:MAG: type 1 periplasmic binding fold superfamily protein [Saprospiraceae bacterium]|nr:type 1 periplasmic binding fold superfamily protein [Saprospiraceae bacterium]